MKVTSNSEKTTETSAMKIAVIGGGSSYTPELINGFVERVGSLPLTDLWLMDISAQRLDVVGGFARRLVQARGAPFAIHLSTELDQALDGARYVITQLRVGGMQARREDEYLGRRHGLIGQETTGVGGMAKALRTIPVVLDIATRLRRLAPDGLLVNFTNPSGLITEALSRYAPDVAAVGVCNAPITTKMGILKALEEQQGVSISPKRAELNTLGLNHLSWHRGFVVDEADIADVDSDRLPDRPRSTSAASAAANKKPGFPCDGTSPKTQFHRASVDVWPQVLEGYLERLRNEPDPEWDPRTIEVLGMIPNYYLQYYYETERKLAAQEKWPPSRAEEVMSIEAELLSQYAEPERTEPPEGLMQRGGAYYSTVATQLLNAHHNDLGETHVVNVQHGGAVAGWPEDWVLELPCRVDASGIHPLPAEPLPAVCYGLLAQAKMYELLTVEAAVHGDRDSAYRALLAHPLGPSAGRVQAVLDDMLETHRDYLPQF